MEARVRDNSENPCYCEIASQARNDKIAADSPTPMDKNKLHNVVFTYRGHAIKKATSCEIDFNLFFYPCIVSDFP